MDSNEKFISEYFSTNYSMQLLPVPRTPKMKTPDFEYTIDGITHFVLEVKSFSTQQFVESDTMEATMIEDRYHNRIQRAIKAAILQCGEYEGLHILTLVNNNTYMSARQLCEIFRGYSIWSPTLIHRDRKFDYDHIRSKIQNIDIYMWIDRFENIFTSRQRAL